jgi:hypothetical protein
VLSVGAASAPPQAEGYLLRVTDRQIVVAGRDPSGAFWGVQTLRQIIESAPVADGRAALLPQIEVRDWPDFAVRGAHLTLFRYQNQRASLPFWEALITRVAGRAKLNTLIVQVDWMLRYRRRPEMAQKTALSIADFRRLPTSPARGTSGSCRTCNVCRTSFRSSGTGIPNGCCGPAAKPTTPKRPPTPTAARPDGRPARRVRPARARHAVARRLDEVEPGLARGRKGENDTDVFLRHLRDLHDDARAAGFANIAFWPDMLPHYDPAARGRRLLAHVPPGTVVCPWDYATGRTFPNCSIRSRAGRSPFGRPARPSTMRTTCRASHARPAAGTAPA